MAAINEKELAKYIGILEIAPISNPTAFERVASVRGLQASYDVTANLVEINADDTGTVYKASIPEANLTCTFLETFNLELLTTLFGATVTSGAGTLVSGATQTITGSTWTELQFIELEGQNASGAAPTINSVTASVSGLMAADNDYFLTKNTEGKWGISISTTGTATVALTEDVVVDYDYTPAANKSTSLSGSQIEIPRLVAKITATDPDDATKERTITIDDASINSAYNMDFLDVVENGDINGTDLTITGNKGCTMSILDEII